MKVYDGFDFILHVMFLLRNALRRNMYDAQL